MSSFLKIDVFTFLLIILIFTTCKNNDTPKPFGALPSKRQMEWHKMDYYAFVHFNINTFSDVEWGKGNEDPSIFNPSQLDCRQWARVCKDAGMEGIIITAKHHDGFCLWHFGFFVFEL
jgi:alpha-L-fucosidase